MANETLGSKLIALKERSKLSLNNIAKAAGYRNASSIQRYFAPEYDAEHLPSPISKRLSEALVGFGDPKIEFEDIHRLTEYGFMLDRASPPRSMIGDQAFQMKETHFVECNATYATGHSLDDAEVFFISNDPRRYFQKPSHLYHRSIEAIFVSTVSAMPRFNPGEVVFFERYRPAALGEDVVVTVHIEGEEESRQEPAIIGKLRAKSRDQVSIEINNPPALIVLSVDQVDDILPILPPADLLAQIAKREAYASS